MHFSYCDRLMCEQLFRTIGQLGGYLYSKAYDRPIWIDTNSIISDVYNEANMALFIWYGSIYIYIYIRLKFPDFLSYHLKLMIPWIIYSPPSERFMGHLVLSLISRHICTLGQPPNTPPLPTLTPGPPSKEVIKELMIKKKGRLEEMAFIPPSFLYYLKGYNTFLSAFMARLFDSNDLKYIDFGISLSRSLCALGSEQILDGIYESSIQYLRRTWAGILKYTTLKQMILEITLFQTLILNLGRPLVIIRKIMNPFLKVVVIKKNLCDELIEIVNFVDVNWINLGQDMGEDIDPHAVTQLRKTFFMLRNTVFSLLGSLCTISHSSQAQGKINIYIYIIS